MATKAQVRDRAAEILGRLPLGQALQHRDKVRIEDGYDEVYDQLKELGLATWPTTGEVPARLVPFVAVLVAQNCLGTYGVSLDRYTRIMNDAGANGYTAQANIRELVAEKYESLDKVVDY